MATVTALLWKHKQNKQGECPIYVRIADANGNRYVSTRQWVKPSDWNDQSAEVRRTRDDYSHINGIVGKKLGEAKAEIARRSLNGEAVTAGALKRKLATGTASGDFIAYGENVAADFRRQGKIHSAVRFGAITSKLKKYTGGPLPFDALTPEFLGGYQTYLIQRLKNHPNTVAANLRCLRTILYRAIRDGHFPQERNPYFKFKIRQKPHRRDTLTVEEVKRIEAVELEDGSRAALARDTFMLSFYLGGVRFGDLCRLRWADVKDDRVVFRMSKTDQQAAVKIVPQAQRILDRYRRSDDERDYLMPILSGHVTRTPEQEYKAIGSENAALNRVLKEVADKAEVKARVSFHVARHSFANLCREKGWSVFDISKALRHANLKVTDNYLRGFDYGGLDQKMEDLFNE